MGTGIKNLIFLVLPLFIFLTGQVSAEARFADERRQMVESQIKDRGIDDKITLAAMLAVPRHEFVLPRYKTASYKDRPLPIEQGQTISQPYIVALMTSQLGLGSDSVVLEIGTGSGYQAAILAEICQEVYTVEIIPELGNKAAKLLSGLKYDNVKIKIGDGYYGWEEHAPYDAIMVTAAAGYVPPPLIGQLKPGGKMIIPVGGVYQTQRLMLITKEEDGTLNSKNLIPVRFVPLTRNKD